MALLRHQNKEIRGRLLKIANVGYPREVSTDVMLDVLTGVRMRITRGALEDHLAYLAGKGYVALEELTSEEIGSLTVVRLTPKGKDLLEGNIADDPGVRV